MESKSSVEKLKQTQSRVEMLQEAWPTGEVERPDAIDWNARINASISKRAHSRLFQMAAVFMTIAAILFIAIPVLCPFAWMAVGMWYMYVQANRNDGKIGRLGMEYLMVGQYFDYGLGVLSALASFVVIVESCTAMSAGQDIQQVNSMFWGSFLVIAATFLVAGLRWKIVCTVKTIKEAKEGTINDGMIPVSAIVVCFAIGIVACLSVVGIFAGVAAILLGFVLAGYRKDMIQLDVDMLEQELAEAERCEIVPTWKKIEEDQK